MAVRDGVDRFGAWRVEDAPQPEELEVDEVVHADLGAPRGRAGRREHPQSLTAQIVDRRFPERDVESLRPVRAALGERTLEDAVGSALHQDGASTAGVGAGLDERRHELVGRVERHDVDAVRARGIRLALHRDDFERALGRLADQGPAAVIGANDLGVVAEVGNGQKRGEVAPTRRRDLAGRVVAQARDLVARDGRHHRSDGHLVLREGAGLVGAHRRHRAERLDGGKLPRDGIPARHLLHADREGDRDERGQALGNRRDREADRRGDELRERHLVQVAADQHHDGGHPENDERQHLPEAVELLREGRRE